MPIEPAADLVLRGGAVRTVDDARPTAEAVAIRAGRFTVVGTDAEVAGLIGARTRVVELRGRTVLPGFQDAHIHAVASGVDQLRCDLLEVQGGTVAVAAAIGDYARSHPDDPWIVGSGWYMADFPGGTPHRRELDVLVADRPAYLENRDGHSAWVNSRALELAGIDADTTDPRGGRIEREADGSPTGCLHESAMDLVGRLLPETTPAERERGLLGAQRYLHSLGITAWQDANIGVASQATYETVAGRGELTARVVGAQLFDERWDVADIPGLVERRATGRVGRFAATSVKIRLDGVLETFTGALVDPYLSPAGEPTDRTGILFFDPELLRQVVARLDAEGFQVHFHAIGDRAVREGLDAIEGAIRANGRGDGRHHMAHIQLIQPVDLGRFAALGVTANAQALWACHDPQMDELTLPILGPERSAWQYPFASLLRSGARLAMGSDWGVSTPNVLDELEVAVERDHPEIERQGAFLPEERLTLDEAVRAFTLGSAYVNHLDETTGSIAPGKLADLVVVDRDLWDRGSGHVCDARVVATFVEGDAVYEDGLEL